MVKTASKSTATLSSVVMVRLCSSRWWATLFLCVMLIPKDSTEFQVCSMSRGKLFDVSGVPSSRRIPAPSFHTRMGISTSDEMQQDVATAQDSLLFDATVWVEYESAIRNMTQSSRVMGKTRKKKTLIDDVAPAIDFLLTNSEIVPLPNLTCCDMNQTSFRSQVKLQKEAYLNATNLTDDQYAFALRILTYMGDYCAKQRKSSKPCLVAWHKLREAGMMPMENCLSTYLYVLGSFDDGELAASVAASQVATFHDALFEPNEKTVTLRIRTMTANDDAAGAEALLESIPTDGVSGDWKRLRTYLPILTLYCRKNDVSSALRLYRRMRDIPEVIFEPDTYVLLMGTLATNGCFQSDAAPIEGAVDRGGFSVSSGPQLFDEIATEMANDVLEMSEEAANTLHDGFIRGFADVSEGTDLLHGNEKGLSPDNRCAKLSDLVVSRVEVDEQTALCPRTQAKLRVLKLTREQRKHVHDTLIEMSATQYEEYVGKMKARFKDKMDEKGNRDYAVQELLRFSAWLDEREGEPFTAIIDGPNVAYFGHTQVHYSQVDTVVKALEAMNERPLVVMPEKYVSPKFKLFMGNVQQLDEPAIQVMNRLLESAQMYAVPSLCLDDYYWMLACVSNQTKASIRVDKSRHVAAHDGSGRFPGLRPMLITNDQMRDHKLELLEPRLFRRWSCGHVVNYNFTDCVEGEWEERDVQFSPADFFSREIQVNWSPLLGDSPVWHFPIMEAAGRNARLPPSRLQESAKQFRWKRLLNLERCEVIVYNETVETTHVVR